MTDSDPYPEVQKHTDPDPQHCFYHSTKNTAYLTLIPSYLCDCPLHFIDKNITDHSVILLILSLISRNYIKTAPSPPPPPRSVLCTVRMACVTLKCNQCSRNYLQYFLHLSSYFIAYSTDTLSALAFTHMECM